MKQRLFISYKWTDGNWYADELEKQLKDDFDVIRDKSKLCVNDSIDDFMRGIADCDIVVLILTAGYLKSDNCMKELVYLVDQPDWKDKAMLLVIDSNLYSVDYQEEIIKYWDEALEKSRKTLESMQRKTKNRKDEVAARSNICDHLDVFFKELKDRNNPSQIAIVKEIYKLAERDKKAEKQALRRGEQKIMKVLADYGGLSTAELSEKTKTPLAVTDRYISRLYNKQKVTYSNNKRAEKWNVSGGNFGG